MVNGDQVISQVKEISESVVNDSYYVLFSPWKVTPLMDEPLLLQEEVIAETDDDIKVQIEPWIRLSGSKNIIVKPTSVLAITDPIVSLMELYKEKTQTTIKD